MKPDVVGSSPTFYKTKHFLAFPMITIYQRSGDKRYIEKLIHWLECKFWVLKVIGSIPIFFIIKQTLSIILVELPCHLLNG